MMKISYPKMITVILLCWMTMGAAAQEKPRWTVGVKGGWSYTSNGRSNMGRGDETYSPQSGFDIGVQARYGVLDWLAIRADLDYMTRSYQMDRNVHHIDQVYTKYSLLRLCQLSQGLSASERPALSEHAFHHAGRGVLFLICTLDIENDSNIIKKQKVFVY